jgi:GxxExxY protein
MISTDSELIFADTTYKIRGAIFAVYNTLGPGHKEIVYQKALEKEFEAQNIPFAREQSLDVKYRNIKVGKYIPDFIVDNKIIVELKAVEFMPKMYENQLIHYLKTTGFQVGLLVNFGQPKLMIKRLVWSPKTWEAESVKIR